MSRIFYISLLSLFLMKGVMADEPVWPSPMIEVKAGYFLFATSHMRQGFDEKNFVVQTCGSYPIWRWLQIYGSIGYQQQTGQSTEGQKSFIWELPIDLGLKPVFTVSKRVQYYFAVGPRYFYAHQHNDSKYVDRNIGKSSVGLFVNTGFNFFLTEHMFLDLFGEYSYQPIHFSPSKSNVYGESVQVGGWNFGGGLGYAF